MSDRLAALRAEMKKETDKYDGLFISKAENRAYLSGFTGSYGFLAVTQDAAILFTDGRYTQQAAQQAPGWKIVRLIRPYEENIIPELKGLGLARLGFEADTMSYAEWQGWADKVEGTRWVATSGIVGRLRRRKDAQEITEIRRAVDIAAQAFDELLEVLKPGMKERDAAAQLEYFMRKNGADAIAFETIVASGPRGALPHGRASDKEIQTGELVTFDFGAHFNGYNSDITRTVFVGSQPEPRQREIYNLVLESQLAGIAAVRPGVKASEVDAASRAVFEKAGMVEYYLHSTGHNLGREVHEAPLIGPTDHTLLEPGMVLTVEPGLYLSDWGGVRIEDDLLVTADGAEVLPRIPKELILL